MAIKRITREEVNVLQRNIEEIEDVVNNLEQLVESDTDLVSRNLNDLWSIRNDLIDLEFKLVRYMP